MKNRLYLFVCMVCLSALSSCAQINKAIAKTEGFYQLHIPGTIAVDEKGNPLTGPNTKYFIYIESKDTVQWAKAWINGKPFTINTSFIKSTPVTIGERKSDHQKIIITAAYGNTLWLLQLEPVEKGEQVKTGEEKIILEGYLKNKKVTQTISSLTELEPDLHL